MNLRVLFVCLIHFIKSSKQDKTNAKVNDVIEEIETLLESKFSQIRISDTGIDHDVSDGYYACFWGITLNGFNDVWTTIKSTEDRMAVGGTKEAKSNSAKEVKSSGSKDIQIEEETGDEREKVFYFPSLTVNVGKITQLDLIKLTGEFYNPPRRMFNKERFTKCLQPFKVSVKFNLKNIGKEGETCTFQLSNSLSLQLYSLSHEWVDVVNSLLKNDITLKGVLREFDKMLGEAAKNTHGLCHHQPTYGATEEPTADFQKYCNE